MGLFRLEFVSPDFVVPETVDADRFHLHPLRLQDSLEDYNAIMEDYPGHMRNFSATPDLGREKKYSIYMNMRELGWHEIEFANRTSFTYVIRGKSPALPSYRGCLYLFPTAKVGFDMEVYLWVTNVEPDDGLEAEIVEWAKGWLHAEWPFETPLWVNRDVSWDDYEKLPDGRAYSGQHWW